MLRLLKSILYFVPQVEPKKVSAYVLIPVCRTVYIHSFKINPLLSALFWKLSQPLDQDQQNSKQTYCQLTIIIFLWTQCAEVSISTFSKSIPLLSALFWKLSQPLGQDQQNSKQTYCQLPIIIFLWTPKGFISPETFFNFLLNFYIPPQLRKCFKFIVLRLLQIHLGVKKLNLFNFTHAPKQNPPPGFYHYPLG